MTRRRNQVRGWAMALLAAALMISLGWPRQAAAQADPKLFLVLSATPWAAKPAPSKDKNYGFRPNVVEEVVMTVVNGFPTERTMAVQFRLGDKEIAHSEDVTVGKGRYEEVKWKPAVAPMTKLPFAELPPGRLVLRLVDKTKKEDVKTVQDVELILFRPEDYLSPGLPEYTPAEAGRKSTLVAGVSAGDRFRGPGCPVELVLGKVRNLIEDQSRRPALGKVDRGQKVELVLEDLRFGGKEGDGLVFVNADGYSRAFAFETTFAATGNASTAVKFNKPYLGIRFPAECADSHKPIHIVVEADNIGPDGYNLDRDEELVLELLGPMSKGQPTVSERWSFTTERSVHWFWAPGEKQGGLQLKAEVKDHSIDPDLSSRVGRVEFRLSRVVTTKDGKEASSSVLGEIFLVDSPPKSASVDLKMDPDPTKKPARGKTISLIATATPESFVREVIFFVGRPRDDGTIPPGVPQAAGAKVKEDGTEWTGELPVPAELKGPMIVSARFVNGAGLASALFKEVEVPDPALETGKKRTLAGVVTESDLTQKDLTVYLGDSNGKVLASKKTGDDGKFAFTDLQPGTYRLYAVKTSTNRKSIKQVTVSEAPDDAEVKKNTSIEMNLYR